MTSPEPELLSLLEKAANPLQQFQMNITLNGVFAPPEEWYPCHDAGRTPMKPIPTSLLTLSASLITSLKMVKFSQER